MKLDSREFSREAHEGLTTLSGELTALANEWAKKWAEKQSSKLSATVIEKKAKEKAEEYCKKASGLVQGLPTYISTWGLHRLSGDAKKFLKGTTEDTKYKGKVYRKFLFRLKEFSQHKFQPDDEGSLIHLPLRDYTALNHLAMQLAKEWSFWAASVLGEAEAG